MGPFATASLLYLGAAAAALVLGGRPRRRGRPPVSPRVLGTMVLAGAVLAPAAFAWGLQRTGATTGSLLLNLEAGFTVLLAAGLLGERIGGRVVAALVLIGVGGVLVGLDASVGGAEVDPLGALALTLATAAWALDNVLARRLEHIEAIDVVLAKGLLGGSVSALIAAAAADPWPAPTESALLLACGAFGYGVSLRLYLAAQRSIGAARTGSVFAVAPFLGAALGWMLGDRAAGWLTALAACLFAIGVALHATEPDTIARERPVP